HHRGVRNVGIQHAVHARVHSVDRFATNHVFQVIARNALAHVAPLAARFEFQVVFLWDFEFRGGCDEFAVASFLSGLAVQDLVGAGGAFRFGHTPFLCSSAHEHQSCGGASFAQRVEGPTNGVGTVGVLVAVLFIAHRLHDFHSIPVGVEFVSDDAGKSGLAAAAHFGAVRDGVDRAVGVDREVGARRGRSLQCDVGDTVRSAGSRGSPGGGSYGGKVTRGKDERAGADHATEKVTAGVTE